MLNIYFCRRVFDILQCCKYSIMFSIIIIVNDIHWDEVVIHNYNSHSRLPAVFRFRLTSDAIFLGVRRQ